jgi:hypothetical protein
MTPKQVDDTDPEVRNALWIMMKYEDERKENDKFIQQSKEFHNQQK